MRKPQLTSEHLLSSGFAEVGCWELNEAKDLTHAINVPRRAGVYAFAIDGVVQYVGLASRSLHQRLNFYRKPGASQRTNVRLNEIIRGQIGKGAVVQILVGHPADGEWNGFRFSGAEGLEAALIEDFELPWNMRGTQAKAAPQVVSTQRSASGARRTGVAQQVVEQVKRSPGLTELEIAKAIYGSAAVQQQVNQTCRKLVQEGVLERRGSGRSDPFVYYLAGAL